MSRTRTGIPEFDEMLNGGFMQKDAVLLAGSAGTDKTTLALQYLVNGIRMFREPGIYVSFEQIPDQIYRDALSFGWDLRKMEDEDNLRVVCTSPNLVLAQGADESILDVPLQEIKARRIVIDSLSHLQMFTPEKDLRLECYRLIMRLKTKELSSLLLWETTQSSAKGYSVSDMGMSFLVDCITLLRFVEIESSMKKAIGIMKMRGSDHDKHLRQYEITSEGIRISDPFEEYEGILSGTPTKTPAEKFVQMFQKASQPKRR
jgi:circadian clock protein KaiC